MIKNLNKLHLVLIAFLVFLSIGLLMDLMKQRGEEEFKVSVVNKTSSSASSASSAANLADVINNKLTIKNKVAAQESSRVFTGIAGEVIQFTDSTFKYNAKALDDGRAKYFNTILPDGKKVYFFIVKSPDGKIRAAANGCQVCGKALHGFSQEGDYMKCNTCGNRYHLNKVATERGGCNPVPIDGDLKIVNGNISISLDGVKAIAQYF